MTVKDRILFGTLFGSLAAAAIAGQLLMQRYGEAAAERDSLYTDVALLINVMAQRGIDVEVLNGLAVVASSSDNPS